QGRVSCESPGSQDVIGSTLRAGPNALVLDLCLPTQDCSKPIRAEFLVTAPGFAGFQQYLAPASFVRVNIAIEPRATGCAQRMTVAGVGSWLGARNPSGRGDQFYFAAGAGATETLGPVPFQLLRCVGGERTLGVTIDETRATLQAGRQERVGSGLIARL